jgi:hypothetical protein
MTLTFAAILASEGLDPAEALVIRHAYVREHEDGTVGIHGDSSDAEILAYTSVQSANTRTFPAAPPRIWIVFRPEGGDRARLWSVLVNYGETDHDGLRRTFHLEHSELMADLRNRLVIQWRSPRTWRINATTAAAYPVMEIADSEPVRFPGFDALTLDYPQLQAVIREHRYAAWRTALSSVIGIYLITDTRDATTSARLTAPRPSGSAGPHTRPTATEATSSSATSTLRATGYRCCGCSTLRPRPGKSTRPRATSSTRSTPDVTGSTATESATSVGPLRQSSARATDGAAHPSRRARCNR